MLSAPTAMPSLLSRVAYPLHKVKSKNQLTPSRKKTHCFSYYIMFPLSFRTLVLDDRIMLVGIKPFCDQGRKSESLEEAPPVVGVMA